MEYLGFDPSTSSLQTTRASDCANTPMQGHMAMIGRPCLRFIAALCGFHVPCFQLPPSSVGRAQDS